MKKWQIIILIAIIVGLVGGVSFVVGYSKGEIKKQVEDSEMFISILSNRQKVMNILWQKIHSLQQEPMCDACKLRMESSANSIEGVAP